MKDPRDVVIRPVISEKSYALIQEANTYTFLVHPDANKTEIGQAVATIFHVQVVAVNTLNRAGKRKRNRRSGTFGRKPGRKRAMVKLAFGDSIPIFEGT